MDLNQLKEAGFNDQEIKEYVNTESKTLLNAGFNQQEVNQYFGIKEVDRTEIKSYWQNIKDEIKQDFEAKKLREQELSKIVKETLVGKEFDPNTYWERGVGKQIFSLINAYNTTGKLPEAFTTPEPTDTGYLEGFIERGVTLFGDLPFYAGGAIAGSPAGPIGAAAGAGLVPGTIRQMYITALEKGEVNTFEEWWKIFSNEGIKAGATEAAQLAVASKLPGSLGLDKTFLPKALTQLAGFEATGFAITGEVPTKDELIYGAGFFAAFGLGEKGVKKVIDQVKQTGKKPSEIYEDSIVEPTIREDLGSKNIEVPRAYEPLVERKVEPPKVVETIKSEKSLDPDIAKVQEKISFEPVEVKTTTKEILNNFTFNWLDKLHPILRAVREAEKLGVKAKEGTVNPYELARLQPGMISRGEHFLKYGTLDFKNLEIQSKPLITILEPITKDISTYKEFGTYAIAKRAIEKSSQGFETGIDIQAAKNTIKNLESKYNEKSNFIPGGIKNTFKELGEYQNNLLKYLKDSGIVNEKTYNLMLEANKDYVPFFRVLEESSKSGPISNFAGNPLKKFKGSDKVIVDPIESIYKNTLHFVTLVERNRSLGEFIKMVEQVKAIDPTAFPEVSKTKAKTKRIEIPKEELEKIFSIETIEKKQKYTPLELLLDKNKKEKIVTVRKKTLREGIDLSEIEGIEIFRKEQPQLGKNEVVYIKDGKREVWDLGSDLSRSWKYSTEASQKLVSSIISLPARTLRAGATLAPEFFLKNAIRDTVSGTVFSRNGFVLGLDTARGMMIQIYAKAGKEKQSKIYQDWIKSGGPQSSYVAFDRNYFTNNIAKELTSRPVYNLVKNPLEMLRVATEFFENATRLGEFQKAYNNSIKKGLTHKQAIERGGFESKNITIDFQKMGAKVGAWNAISAFFNARIQGYLKIYDSFKNPETRSKALYIAGASITLPSILLWIANHDDERYKELPQWQKDLFWIIITGEGKDTTVWRIPKPFELGYVFGTLPEKALDFIKTQDPSGIKNFIKDLAFDNATSILPIPDIAKPVIEAWSNKSLFTKKPIVPRSLEGVLPEYQYTEYTSETSKILGKLIRQISGDYSGISSPARIESTINNWTGTLGRTFVSVLDKALIASGVVDDPIKPTQTLADIPIVRAFIVRTPSAGSEYITTFYDKYSKVNKIFNSIEKLQKAGDFQEANKLLSNLPAEASILKSSYKIIQDNGQRVRNIYNSKLFTPDQKRQFIDELYRQMIDISKYSLEVLKDIK
jgi:hypothetical protein